MFENHKRLDYGNLCGLWAAVQYSVLAGIVNKLHISQHRRAAEAQFQLQSTDKNLDKIRISVGRHTQTHDYIPIVYLLTACDGKWVWILLLATERTH